MLTDGDLCRQGLGGGEHRLAPRFGRRVRRPHLVGPDEDFFESRVHVPSGGGVPEENQPSPELADEE